MAQVQALRDSVYLCAACGADGVVRISVTKDPAISIKRRASIVAAQWAWVGSESRAKLLVRRLRSEWASRYVLGEGYRFDYGSEGAAFRHGLDAAFRDVAKASPQWEKLWPDSLTLLTASQARRSRHEAPTT